MSLRFVKIAFLVFIFLGMANLVLAQSDEGITWKLAFLKGEIVSQTVPDLTKPVQMKDGEKFQLFIHIVNPEARVYILYHGADDSIEVLSYELLPANTAYMLPSPYQTYTMTPPAGVEKIYVIVSKERQLNLENLLSKKKRDTKAILEELKAIQQKVLQIAEEPQKPVPIGGTVRGGAELLQATQYTGQETYVRIIRIEH
jgi:hypothetical protein